MVALREGSERKGARTGLVIALGVVLLAVGVWAYASWRAEGAARERAENALRLQVLASRLGAATLLAEYGDYGEAQTVLSGVFNGIRNYGIEEGVLPENYATVLAARDSVMLGLERRGPEVRRHLVDLFFLVQLPADTELDPERIIPATDSGSGISAPIRRVPAGDTASVTPPSTGPGSPMRDTTARPPG